MSLITNIVVHCSDSSWGCARAIRQWHQAKGWKDIGYHFVILNGFFGPGFEVHSADGSIEAGRYLDDDDMLTENEVGAHALGYNGNSVGICLIGKKDFTPHQISALVDLVKELQRKYNVPTTNVIGHYETASGRKEGKTCPGFDMAKFRAKLT